MKKPAMAPALFEAYRAWTTSRDLASSPIPGIILGEKVTGPSVNGKYLHWDELQHRSPPEGLDHLGWWFGLKVHRNASQKQVPLLDKGGTAFSYNLVDPLPEHLHNIDSMARGMIGAPESIANPETKNRYLVRSLIEEATTSSQLEGASTTREVAKEMIRQGRTPRDRSEQMILNNYLTMRKIGEIKGEKLTKELVFEIHRMVTDRTLDDLSGAGRFRRPDQDIYVGDDLDEVFHRPPDARELDRRMDAMCAFANGKTPNGFVHPAIRSIVLHFWLAYDHPFVDGNGRTARALFYWSMLRQKYRLFEFVSISEIILRAPVKYGRAFLYTETDSNDLTYFLLYHADVISKAIDRLHEYIDRKAQSIRNVEAGLKGFEILNHRQRTLIGHALRHPGQRYTVESHRVSQGIVYQTARNDLLQLADLGLLRKYKQGKAWEFVAVENLEDRLKTMN